jgi:hypothetical protein
VNVIEYGNENANFGPNWALLILPYIEQNNLYQLQATSIQSYMQTGDSNWRILRTNSLRLLLCPSDTGSTTPYSGVGGNWARGNYAANAGPSYWDPYMSVLAATANGQWYTWGSAYTDQCTWALNIFPPICEVSFPFPGGGVMSVNYGATLPVLSAEDGNSQTILFNEVRIGPSASDLRGTWAMGQIGASITGGCPEGDCWGPNDRLPYSDNIHLGEDLPNIGMGACNTCNNSQANARSQHFGGINACFADGSLHYISNNIDLTVWFMLQSRNDGQVFPTDSY